jgi:uncharacterized protein (DUF885 family)
MKPTISKTIFAALLATTASAALVSCSEPAKEVSYSQEQIETESERLYGWFDEVFNEDLNDSPLTLTFFGRKDRNDEIDDFSDAQALKDHETTKERLNHLASFDFDALSEEAQLSYRLFELQLERSIEGFDYRFHNYPVNQFFGWHTQFPVFMANFHRVDEVADAEAFIARLDVTGRVFGQLIDGLQRRDDMGILPPKWVYPFVIEAVGNVLKGAPFDDSGEDSVFLAGFKKKLEGLEITDEEKAGLIARVEVSLVENVQPAYEKLGALMAAQEQKAGTDDGVWRLPDGAANYNRLLGNYTTTDLTAEEIHQMGLENVERIHGEMRGIMAEVGFEGSLQEFFEFMRTDPQFYYENTDEGREKYMAEATALIDTMRDAIPDYFGLLPKAGIEVKRVEPFRENSAGKAFYNRPSQDGSRPGVYYANLKDMAEMPNYQMAALAYHEGIPGHHMQIAISLELESIPEFQKQSGFTAYTEGWGLYSEFLPKEMGFYQDPYSDFGRLAMELWRAVRLVVDTGIHYKRWTREQTVAYMMETTPNPEGDIRSAVNRYIVFPGQATAYLIGKIKILELREWARAELGDAFDISGYHDEVLRQGAVPLNILEENIASWVARIKAGE